MSATGKTTGTGWGDVEAKLMMKFGSDFVYVKGPQETEFLKSCISAAFPRLSSRKIELCIKRSLAYPAAVMLRNALIKNLKEELCEPERSTAHKQGKE
ncbi:hypothetical protein ACFL5V_11495 [Fibrobacterota bacterium]